MTQAIQVIRTLGNMGDGTGGEWNGGLIINDYEYKKDEYVISEIDGESHIFLPYERYKYPFKCRITVIIRIRIPICKWENHDSVKNKDGK